MGDQFYTKDELELFGGSAATENNAFSQSPQNVEMMNAAPAQQSDPFQQPQGVYYQQPTSGNQGFVQQLSDPGSDTYRKIQKGASIASAVKQIIFGSIFILMPLCAFPMFFSVTVAEGAGAAALFPILFIALFVISGGTAVVKGIINLILILKNK